MHMHMHMLHVACVYVYHLMGTSADNMGVLCNIMNGAAKELDAGTVTFALHLRLAELKASCGGNGWNPSPTAPMGVVGSESPVP